MPVAPNNLINIINKNKSKKLVANKILETNPQILPVLPKLVRDPNISGNIEENKINVNRSILEDIYNRIKSVKHNNKNILKLFPDIELAIQILVSSILSPKKMTDIQLNFKLDKKISIPSQISAETLDKIKSYINDNYELEEKLPEIVREALFNSGAYVQAIIPESSVDDVINTDILPSYSAEDFKHKVDHIIDTLVKPINILNTAKSEAKLPSTNLTKESFVTYLASESFVKVTDNVKILHFNNIKEKINTSLIKSSLKRNTAISQESLDKVNYMDIFRQKKTTISQTNVEFIKTKFETTRKTLGKPMITKIPTEAIIPVFIPGNESEHIGYFVLLDEAGKPLNTELKDNNIAQVNTILQTSAQTQLTPVQKAYNSLVTDVTSNVNVNELFEMYKDVLEKQLYSSIRSSLYGSNADIAGKNDIYFLMFTRALAEQKTSLLFIPKELVVYFAFYYNDIGIGKTLLENLSVLSSLRAILLFSKVMAYAKQSIDVTKVNISLDPHDPDPEKTIEQIQDSVLKLRQNYFPLGINNPVDLVNWIQRAGLQFSYENNPLIPNVKIDFENANLTHTVPSSELEEELRKQTILALGLSPETIDTGFSPEFATTVVNNNILLSKRISVYQKTLSKHLNKLVNLLIYNDEDLRTVLRGYILDQLPRLEEILSEEEKQFLNRDKAGFIEYYIDHFAENIIIELPKPDNTNIATLSVEFDIYKENLEKIVNTFIGSEIFTEDISGEISQHIDTVKTVYTNFLLRKWCATNNFYPEIAEFNSGEEEDIENMLSNITNHLSSTMGVSTKLLTTMQKFKDAVNKDLNSVDGEGGDSSSTSSSSSESESEEGSSSEEEGGDITSDDDMNLDF